VTDPRPIGVFDSGLGGLTVARALIDLLPSEDLVFFGDNGRFPYGPKPAEDVRGYAIEIAGLLVARGVKMIVVACNTASAAALDVLRRDLPIPVVGVVEPGLRAAIKVTESGRIGVIGTVGTIASGAYQRAASAAARGVECDRPSDTAPSHDASSGRSPGPPPIDLYCAACPGFVEFVEAGEVDSDQVHVLAERLLDPVRRAQVDTLVLGCTHYPLLARTIADVMGRDVVLVSSADETAFEVRAVLERAGALAPDDRLGQRAFVTSGDVGTFQALGVRFCGPEVVDVEAWCWPNPT
jgi:glutamate racemase